MRKHFKFDFVISVRPSMISRFLENGANERHVRSTKSSYAEESHFN